MASTISVATVVSSVCIESRVAIGATDFSPASWPYPNAEQNNTRDAASSLITSANVSTLKEAWSFTLRGNASTSVGGSGTIAAGPIVLDGIVYIQDLHSNVYALSLATGKLDWQYLVNKKELSGPGPNGVAVANGVVYGATPTTVFALNASNGQVIWLDKHLLKKGEGTFGIQPQADNGRLYLASQYGIASGGGVLLAVDAKTGHRLWTFKTVPALSTGVTSLGLGAGGAWEPPLVGPDETVTYGIGNPYQTVGSAYSNPAKLLYTDSVVQLNATTGRLRWYYQGVANDFKDYDMQASPISATANGVPVILGGGKMGIVYEMSAATGTLLWKTQVGTHNGHDDDSLKALDKKSTLKLPLTYEPGALGGILTNMALAGDTVYVATCNFPFRFKNEGQVNGLNVNDTLSGAVEALNVVTGKVQWSTTVNDLPLGAATVSNDLIFTTLLKGRMIALSRATGRIVYTLRLPRATNAPIAIAGGTIIVPDGGPVTKTNKTESQVVAYRLSPG
jgi:glucose dehydrogenase